MKRVKDNKPIQFVGNKVVVSEQWAVKFDYKGKKLFTPWMHVGSLVGLEFVDSQAYFQQFRQNDGKESVLGFVTYLRRCQFCHGANGVGAKYGPDFLSSPALHQRVNVDQLFKHVREEKSSLVRTVTSMPAQNDVTKEEIRALWHWSKVTDLDKMTAYKP
jgi:hypothetical protein